MEVWCFCERERDSEGSTSTHMMTNLRCSDTLQLKEPWVPDDDGAWGC